MQSEKSGVKIDPTLVIQGLTEPYCDFVRALVHLNLSFDPLTAAACCPVCHGFLCRSLH